MGGGVQTPLPIDRLIHLGFSLYLFVSCLNMRRRSFIKIVQLLWGGPAILQGGLATPWGRHWKNVQPVTSMNEQDAKVVPSKSSWLQPYYVTQSRTVGSD